MPLTRRSRKALIAGLVALMFALNAAANLYESGAHLPKLIVLGLGMFGVGAAFRAIISEIRDQK